SSPAPAPISPPWSDAAPGPAPSLDPPIEPPPRAAEAAPEPGPAPAARPEPSPEPAIRTESSPAAALNPPAAMPSHAPAMMARLAFGVLVVVALINVPLNARGTALARSVPSSVSVVIRNGLVVKEAASPEIWVYRDGSFHWISSLDAFQQLGYRWEDVHVV